MDKSVHFSLRDWKRRRIEYWQPVLYFTAERKSGIRYLDFNICAKNACTSIKGYFTHIKDPDFVLKKDEDILKRLLEEGTIKQEEISKADGHAYITHVLSRRDNRVALWLNNKDTDHFSFFRNIEGCKKFAIKRNPIERFVSGYFQIYEETGWSRFKSHKYNIDQMLDHLEAKSFWNEHLAPQSWWMGDNPSKFDYIFDIKQTDLCIQTMHQFLGFKSDPPKLHLMKFKYEKPTLTRTQISRIEQIYIEDYQNGWY